MGNRTNPANEKARERLAFIETVAYWRGWLQRGDVTARFGISNPQATADVAAYRRVNRGALFYNKRRKRFEAKVGMRCVIKEPQFESGLAVLGQLMGLDSGGLDLNRQPRPNEVVRPLVQAACASATVNILYYDDGAENWHTIVPRAFERVAWHWHMRAWDVRTKNYRNYLVALIGEVRALESEPLRLPPDKDWRTFITLKLRPRPDLPVSRRKLIEVTFGMHDGVYPVRVRLPLVGLVLEHFQVFGHRESLLQADAASMKELANQIWNSADVRCARIRRSAGSA